MRKLLFALALFALAPGAVAQNAVTQNGSIVVNHLPIFRQDRQIGDIGGLTGQTSGPKIGYGAAPFSVTDNLGCGLQFNTAVTTGSYESLCFGHASDGSAVINASNDLKIIVNGTTYPFPGQVTGAQLIPTNTALKAVDTATNTTVIRTGFYAPGDSPVVTYTWTASCPGTVDDGKYVASNSGGSGCWDGNLFDYDVRTWGAKCDGTTDDTAAFVKWMVWVNAGAQGAIPGGTCVTTGGFIITKPTTIAGRGKAATIMSLKSGSTQPVFTVSVVGNIPGGYTGVFPAQVELTGFEITSPDRTNLAGQGTAHAIRLLDPNPPVTQATNNTTANGNPTLHFASVPATIQPGQFITDNTTGGVIPALTRVLSTTSTTVVMAANATGGGVGNGDSITFTTQSNVKITLNDMHLASVPGDGLHAGAGEFVPGSWVEAYNTDIILPGGNGLLANSTSDWNWHGGQFYGAIGRNLLISGSINMGFHTINEYQAQGDAGIQIANSSVTIDSNSYIDLAYKDSILITNAAADIVNITDSTIRCSSFGTTNTYSDLHLGPGNAGNIWLTNVNFPTPASCSVFGGGIPHRNITFDGGGSPDGHVYMVNSKFALGNFLTTGVSNAPSLIYPADATSSFTPTFIGSTGGSATLSAAKAGRVTYNLGHVTAQVSLTSTSIAGLSGDMQVAGLPIAAQSTDANARGVCNVLPILGWTAAAGYANLGGTVPSGGSLVSLFETRLDGAVGRASPTNEWANASQLSLLCEYDY